MSRPSLLFSAIALTVLACGPKSPADPVAPANDVLSVGDLEEILAKDAATGKSPTTGRTQQRTSEQESTTRSNPFAPRIEEGDTTPTAPRPSERSSRRRITPRDVNPPLVTVSFVDTNIEDVLATFASYSARSILIGDGVQGKRISADIYGQPWHIALEQILTANGLEPYEDSETGIISIRSLSAARELEEHERPAPEVFKISYAPAQDIAAVLSEVLGDRISVTQMAMNNSLMVSASPETMEEVEGLITKMDVRPPTVSVAAKIITVARSEMEALGFRYSLEDPSNPYEQSGGGFTSTSGMPQVFVEPSGIATNHPPLLLNRKSNATLSSFLSRALKGTPYSLTAFVDAMAGVALAEVEAAPVINVQSDESATIEAGDAYHIPTVVSPVGVGGNQSGGGANTSGGTGSSMSGGASGGMNRIQVGVTLEVTPSVTANGKIRIEVSAKRSGGEIDANGTVKESFQSGSTKLIVDSGETIVLGGMTLNETSRGYTGVPLLKDLPLIGRLFRTESRATSTRDLIILITPTIVRSEEQQVPTRQ